MIRSPRCDSVDPAGLIGGRMHIPCHLNRHGHLVIPGSRAFCFEICGGLQPNIFVADFPKERLRDSRCQNFDVDGAGQHDNKEDILVGQYFDQQCESDLRRPIDGKPN